MNSPGFQIHISNYTSSVDEWRKAQEVPPSDLPKLTSQQKEVAQKFGITEEEYARNVLAGMYGRQRMRARAQALGEESQGVLEELGRDYRVVAVSRDFDRLGWIVRIETAKEDVDVFISQEMTDDLLDSGSAEQKGRLRSRIVSSLPQDAPSGKK